MTDDGEQGSFWTWRWIAFACGGIALLAIVLVIAWAGTKALVRIEADERGVVLSSLEPKGHHDEILTPGVHVIVPFLESAKTISIAPQRYVTSSDVGSGQPPAEDPIAARTTDEATVYFEVSVAYAVNPDRVFDVYMNWMDRHHDHFVRPIVRGTVRDVAGQHDAFTFRMGKTGDLERSIASELERRFEEQGFQLLVFRIDQYEIDRE